MTEEMALELKAHLNACNVKRAYNWYNTIFVEHTVNKFKETKIMLSHFSCEKYEEI